MYLQFRALRDTFIWSTLVMTHYACALIGPSGSYLANITSLQFSDLSQDEVVSPCLGLLVERVHAYLSINHTSLPEYQVTYEEDTTLESGAMEVDVLDDDNVQTASEFSHKRVN